MMQPRPYDGVAVAIPTSLGYARSSRRSIPWFLGRLLAELLAHSRIPKAEIDGIALASYGLHPDNAASLSEHLGLAPRFLVDLPYGGASGVIALRRAARAVQAGDADLVACLAADNLGGGQFQGLVANFSSFSRDHVYPYGAAGPNGVFALITDRYMTAHGVTRADFGRLCVAQRANAAANPLALLRRPLTLEAYLTARPIAPPLGLLDCVMPCCGAEGFLVMTEDRARALALPYATVAGAIERHNAWHDDPVQRSSGWSLERDSLYAQASCAPTDIDCLELYDDYPVVVAMQLEDLGFAAEGDGARLAARHDLTCGGDLPLNTSGGQLSTGQAGAAGGFLGVVEVVRQVTRQPLGAPVPDAQRALVAGYGTVTYDRGLCSAAAILRQGRAA